MESALLYAGWFVGLFAVAKAGNIGFRWLLESLLALLRRVDNRVRLLVIPFLLALAGIALIWISSKIARWLALSAFSRTGVVLFVVLYAVYFATPAYRIIVREKQGRPPPGRSQNLGASGNPADGSLPPDN